MAVEETMRSLSLTLARFTGFAANAFIFGLVPILLLMLRPTFVHLQSGGWRAGRRRLAERLEGLVQAALTASALATLVVVTIQAVLVAELNEGNLGLSSVGSVFETSFGQWYLLRLPLLVALAFLLIGRVRQAALGFIGERGAPTRLWWIAWTVLAAALLGTSTFSGHAAVAMPRAVALLNDLVHLGAGAVWFTGIIVLALALPDSWREKDPVARLQVLTPCIVRFSRIALVSLALVAVTGTVNSLLHVEAVDDLVDSGYGRTLALKIGLFLIILAVGGVNHFFIRAKLQEASERGEPTRAQRTIRRTVALELAVAVGVMALTGLLVGLARTRQNELPVRDTTATAPQTRTSVGI